MIIRNLRIEVVKSQTETTKLSLSGGIELIRLVFYGISAFHLPKQVLKALEKYPHQFFMQNKL